MTLAFQSIIDVCMRDKEGEIGRKGKEREWGEGRGEYMNPRCYWSSSTARGNL